MQYVKVQNGEVEMYPYGISQLKSENPNTSFPKNMILISPKVRVLTLSAALRGWRRKRKKHSFQKEGILTPATPVGKAKML